MIAYPVRRISKAPNPWLFRPRLTRGDQLVGAQIHASRSGISDGDDGPRTGRWMWNANNGSAAQGWGGSCDLIISENGDRLPVNPNPDLFEPTYSAGFGDSGTWSGGWFYRQIEMAQGRTTDPYTFAQIDSLAEYLVAENVPPIRIPWLTQTGIPPVGICTHEDSENGRKLGKSDPGPLFPWALLFERMAARGSKEDDMALTPEDKQWIHDEIKQIVRIELGGGEYWNPPDTYADWLPKALESVLESHPVDLASLTAKAIAKEVNDEAARRLTL